MQTKLYMLLPCFPKVLLYVLWLILLLCNLKIRAELWNLSKRKKEKKKTSGLCTEDIVLL